MEPSLARLGRAWPSRAKAGQTKIFHPGWVLWGWEVEGEHSGAGDGALSDCRQTEMYCETGRRRKISESPPPRGNHAEGKIIHPFSIHDSTRPKIALQPSTPSKAEPGQEGLGRAEWSRAKPNLNVARPIGVELSLSRTEPSLAKPR